MSKKHWEEEREKAEEVQQSPEAESPLKKPPKKATRRDPVTGKIIIIGEGK